MGGGKVEADFIFLGSKITVDGDYSHEIKRCSLLGRKGMSNLDSILKSRDIPLPTKVCIVKAMAFPVVIYWCDSWTPKEAEHERIDAFKLWCWRRLLRVPWRVPCCSKEIQPVHPKGNHSRIVIGRTDAEAEAPILWPPDVKHWYLKRPWCWERLRREEKGWQRMRLLDSTTDSVDMSVSKFQDIVEDREAWWLQPMGLQGVGHKWAKVPTTVALRNEVRLSRKGGTEWRTGRDGVYIGVIPLVVVKPF